MRFSVVVLVALLAGCTAELPRAEGDDGLGLDEEPRAGAGRGVIRGVVVDLGVQPIEGALVVLVSTGANVTTNQNGAFAFSHVEPGAQILQVSKPGFETVQASVEVVAGVERPEAHWIRITADPSTQPRVVPLYHKGHMGCSLSYIALCGLPVLNTLTDDAFLAEFDVDGPPQWINMESVWQGTQPTGNQMNLNMGRTPAGPATTCRTAQGPSPLLITLDEANITSERCGIGRDGDLVGRMFAWEMEGTNIQHHTGQCIPVVLTTYCQGPGMAVDQDFELFVHLFYNWVPFEGWRFTEHSEPVPP